MNVVVKALKFLGYDEHHSGGGCYSMMRCLPHEGCDILITDIDGPGLPQDDGEGYLVGMYPHTGADVRFIKVPDAKSLITLCLVFEGSSAKPLDIIQKARDAIGVEYFKSDLMIYYISDGEEPSFMPFGTLARNLSKSLGYLSEKELRERTGYDTLAALLENISGALEGGHVSRGYWHGILGTYVVLIISADTINHLRNTERGDRNGS